MSRIRVAKGFAIVALIAMVGVLISTASPESTIDPPTPQPGKRLETAETYRRNGDYERAIAEYEAIIASRTGEEAREALFRKGECHLLNGDHETAIEVLRKFLRIYPEDERSSWALFLLARAYEGLEDWSHAIAYYRRYLARRKTIASYVYELIGDCYMRMGDYLGAVSTYKAALRDVPSPRVEVDIREKAAKACLELEDYQEALAQYQAILSIAKIGSYRARILYLTGLAYREWGREDESHVSFLEAVDRYPKAKDTHLALVELVEDGVAVNELQRGLVDYHAGAYRLAIRAFLRYIGGDSAGGLDKARYYLGLAYKGAGDRASAMAQFDALIEGHPQSRYWGWAWLEKAELLAELGRVEEAVEVCYDFAELYPYHKLAGEALWRAARLLDDQGRYREAAQAYLDFRARFPWDERAQEALFRAGLCYYRSADYGEAIGAWQELLDSGGSEMRPKALLWMGKGLLRQGEVQKARGCFEKAAEDKAGGYYAWRAKALSLELRGISPLRKEDLHLSAWDEAGREEAERWLASWLGVPKEDLGKPDPSVEGDPRFKRGRELLKVGLEKEAERELRSLVRELRDSPLPLYRLALAFRQMGLCHLSILCAERLIELSPPEAPAFLWRLAYPDCFGDLVAEESRANGLDPLLLLALIRQESTFGVLSTSPAGAKGLTQIIPATGEWIALKLRRRDYTADALYRPCVNVKFGAWYLARQIEDFGGEILAALAAYNAGPNKARRWLKEAGGDVDLLVETIPADEPRHFIKGVCQHYAMYHALYELPQRREVSDWRRGLRPGY